MFAKRKGVKNSMRESCDIQSKVKNISFYAIPLLFVLLGCLMCFNDTIWVDETFSVEMVKHSFIDMIKLDAMDVHPPLYYLNYKTCAELFLENGGVQSV